MHPREKWNEYLHNMFAHASDEFRRTDYYLAAEENVKHIEGLCKNCLNREGLGHATAWIDVICGINSEESAFMYERGYHDCVAMLKCMGVL